MNAEKALRMQDVCSKLCWRCKNKNCRDRIKHYKLITRAKKLGIKL